MLELRKQRPHVVNSEAMGSQNDHHRCESEPRARRTPAGYVETHAGPVQADRRSEAAAVLEAHVRGEAACEWPRPSRFGAAAAAAAGATQAPSPPSPRRGSLLIPGVQASIRRTT
eukprot:3694147-Pleurochrysis_carterae.AAC.1